MKLIRSEHYKSHCRYHYKNGVITSNVNGTPDCYYVSFDHLYRFSKEYLPRVKGNITIFTSTTDWPITSTTSGAIDVLNSQKVTRWFGSNIDIVHPKLFSIPIGLAYEGERPGVEDMVNSVIHETCGDPNYKKRCLVYASYSFETNEIVRRKCFAETKIMYPWVGFRENLEAIARSLFVISPNGNGFDCHRHWESLYLKTIPIVTEDNVNIKFYSDIPFLVIKSWEDFKRIKLSEDLYNRIWNGFDSNNLNVDVLIQKSIVKKHPLI